VKWFVLFLLLTGCTAPDGNGFILMPARELYGIYLAGARDECFRNGIDEILQMDIPFTPMMLEMLAISCESKARQLLDDRMIPIRPERIPNISPSSGKTGT
jgi:hypothetical protein